MGQGARCSLGGFFCDPGQEGCEREGPVPNAPTQCQRGGGGGGKGGCAEGGEGCYLLTCCSKVPGPRGQVSAEASG